MIKIEVNMGKVNVRTSVSKEFLLAEAACAVKGLLESLQENAPEAAEELTKMLQDKDSEVYKNEQETREALREKLKGVGDLLAELLRQVDGLSCEELEKICEEEENGNG